MMPNDVPCRRAEPDEISRDGFLELLPTSSASVAGARHGSSNRILTRTMKEMEIVVIAKA